MNKNINIYNTYLSGGAAIALLHITRQLQQEGVVFNCFHFDNKDITLNDNFIRKKAVFKSKKDKLLSLLKPQFNYKSYFKQLNQISFKSDFDLFSNPVNHWQSPVDPIDNNTIIHLNWISQFIDYPSFFKNISNDTPIIWSLHDANPFTGGCHVPFGCTNFKEECKNCPQINDNNPPIHWAHNNYLLKSNILKNKRLIVVGNSTFTTQLVQQSSVFPKHTQFKTIHLGLPADQLKIIDKRPCKTSLSLSDTSFIIGFVAQGLSNPNKGFLHFCKIVEQLNKKGVETVGLVLGSNAPKINYTNMVFLGNSSSSHFKSIFYNACDAVLTLSQFESFGLVPLESLFCGTPVFGFNSGGVKDIVYSNELGKLSEINDTTSVINNILDYRSSKVNQPETIRNLAINKFNIQHTTQKYLDLYNSL